MAASGGRCATSSDMPSGPRVGLQQDNFVRGVRFVTCSCRYWVESGGSEAQIGCSRFEEARSSESR